MITETRESRTRLLHTYERHPRRRHHHTLDNATLDQFNFVCIPLHLNKSRTDLSSSQSNLIITSSNGVLIPKSKGVTSPTRRVRFKFEENHQTHSSEDVRTPKKYSIHRVEFQIPIQRDINAYLNVDCTPTPAKTRSITSKKIDINFNNTTHHPQGMSVDSSTSVGAPPRSPAKREDLSLEQKQRRQ